MTDLVRITKLGGRYLVFDVHDVAALRRAHGICAVFVGTTPQNPNQNVFAGLPAELLAEEAALLVGKGAAYVTDDAAAHLAHLAAADPSARHAYLQSLRTRRRLFQKAAAEGLGEKRRVGEAKRLQNLAKTQAAAAAAAAAAAQKEYRSSSNSNNNNNQNPRSAAAERDPPSPGTLASDVSSALLAPPEQAPQETKARPAAAAAASASASAPLQHITPTTSAGMLAGAGPSPAVHAVPVEAPPGYPLYKHLNARGYYITPGIRFGADYSVYPGDPFRYHAHFMATSYAWAEEIDVLDLVAGGRLGTGVKKGFMIGGVPPQQETGPEGISCDDSVRAFTIEWAAM